jgi:hypothetical protein
MNSRRTILAFCSLWIALAGCGRVEMPRIGQPTPAEPALPPRYADVEPHRVRLLADFESRGRRTGLDHAMEWTLVGNPQLGERDWTDTRAASGSGCLMATLPPAGELTWTLPQPEPVDPYRLLCMEVHVAEPRCDLRVRLGGAGRSYTSPPKVLTAGWNHIEVDLQTLAGGELRVIGLSVDNPDSPVELLVDDVVLLDNRRAIDVTPPGLGVRAEGLSWSVTLPGGEEIAIAPGPDGLPRLGVAQPVLRLRGVNQPPEPKVDPQQESVDWLGEVRIGLARLAEANALRLRFVLAWRFPAGVQPYNPILDRWVQWELTIYGDGREVLSVWLSNAGGEPIRQVALTTKTPVSWAGGATQKQLIERDFIGPVGRWNALLSAGTLPEEQVRGNYLAPAAVELDWARKDWYAPGDLDRDGFDESQGCYAVAARSGRCLFTLRPGREALVRPIVRVAGPFGQVPAVQASGRVVREVVLLEDGSALLALPGQYDRAVMVEVIAPTQHEKKNRRITIKSGRACCR